MKLNKLYHSILNAQWAVHYESVINYAPLIQSLLEFRQSDIPSGDDKPEAIISYIDPQGRRYGHDHENPDNLPENSVATIELIGVFTKYGNMCQYGTEEIAAVTDMAMANPKVLGAVLQADSGGGAVNAIPPLLAVLNNRTKPVVTLADTCASACYYAAAHTDHIMAANNLSSAFGSIGVMITLADIRPKLEKEGWKIHTVYAPESEHKNQAFELLLKGEYDQIKTEMLSPLAKQFQAAVRQHRGSKLKEEVTGVLTGKMFRAENAVDVGLADSVGNLMLAQEKVRELASDKKLMLRLAARSMFN